MHSAPFIILGVCLILGLPEDVHPRVRIARERPVGSYVPLEYPLAFWVGALQEQLCDRHAVLLRHARKDCEVATGLPQKRRDQCLRPWTDERLHHLAALCPHGLAPTEVVAVAVVAPH